MNWRRIVVLATVGVLALTACDRIEGADKADQIGPSEESTVNTEALSEELTTDYSSSTGQFRLSYPTAWVLDETLGDGALLLGNTQAALDRHVGGAPPAAGDLVVNVGFLPFTLFQRKELKPFDLQLQAPPDRILQSVLPVFHTKGDAVLGEADLVSLSEERDAGMVTVSAGDREGLILMFSAGDQVVALISTVASPGEMSRFEDVTYRIASEVVFEGDGEALYGRLLIG
jgi:hypothetical protein